MNDVLSTPKPRPSAGTITGLQPESRPPTSSRDSSEERLTPVIENMPDSFGAMAQKCISLGKEKQALNESIRKLTDELEKSRETTRQSAQALAELETELARAKREQAIAEAAHRAAEDDLDKERAASAMAWAKFEMEHVNDLEDLRRAIGTLTQKSTDETVACYRRISEHQRRQVEAYQAHILQDPQQVNEEFQAAFHQVLGAMASLGVAFMKATGQDPLNAQQAGRDMDPDEFDRLSRELEERFSDSTRPTPSFPPTSIPLAPRVPTTDTAQMSRSPRPDEIVAAPIDDEDEVPQRNTLNYMDFAPPGSTQH